MVKEFTSANFGWGTIHTTKDEEYGQEDVSKQRVRTGPHVFDGNLEDYTLEIQFEDGEEPTRETIGSDWDVKVYLYDKVESKLYSVKSYSKSSFKSVTTTAEYTLPSGETAKKEQTTYVLKTPTDITGIPTYKELLTLGAKYDSPEGIVDYIMSFYLDIKVSSGNPKKDDNTADVIKSIKMTSLYKMNLKNEKMLAIGAPDIPPATYVSPIPEGAWRIDGIYNHGFPYIKRSKDIPYSMRVPPYETISLMDQIRVTSLPHGLNDLFPVTKMSIPLDKPEETKYTLGSTQTESMTTSSNSVSSDLSGKLKEVPKASTILSLARSNAANLLKAATNGFVTLHQKDGHCDEIIISDEPDYTTAKNVWRWNVNGLGFSDHGYDADEWKAAITMDGAIVADRITAGTMFADRIHGGTLTLGGYDNVNGELRVIAGSSENDKHAVVKMDKDGAYIEGRTISKNPDNGYSIVIRDGAIHGYSDYDEGKQSNDDNLVNYIHMTNGIQGYDDYGLGFWAKGPIMFNCEDILVGNVASGGSEALQPTYGKQELNVVTNVYLTGNKDDGYNIKTDTKTLYFMHGIMTSDFTKQ